MERVSRRRRRNRERIYIRTGFLTDFDPDRAPRVSSVYESPRIHRFGFSINAAIHRKRRWIQTGLAALFGAGTRPASASNARSLASLHSSDGCRSLFLLSVTHCQRLWEARQQGARRIKKRREDNGDEDRRK